MVLECLYEIGNDKSSTIVSQLQIFNLDLFYQQNIFVKFQTIFTNSTLALFKSHSYTFILRWSVFEL